MYQGTSGVQLAAKESGVWEGRFDTQAGILLGDCSQLLQEHASVYRAVKDETRQKFADLMKRNHSVCHCLKDKDLTQKDK